MHRFGFAIPLMFTVPSTVILLITVYALREQDTCAFHGIIPDYLFFEVPRLKSFKTIFSEWYVCFSIFWWISQIWITSHVWTSTCERLARAVNIFTILTYDSLVIDQSLPLNRRKKTLRKRENRPLNKVSLK